MTVVTVHGRVSSRPKILQVEILNPWRCPDIHSMMLYESRALPESQIFSREIDPVLFIHLLTTDNFVPLVL